MSNKSSSRMGTGLMAGVILGLAAGLFLQSRKGKRLTKDAQKKAAQLQVQVMKKLKGAESLTRDKYDAVVDQVLMYYTKSKEIAKTEIPQVRKFLMGQWKEIQAQLKK